MHYGVRVVILKQEKERQRCQEHTSLIIRKGNWYLTLGKLTPSVSVYGQASISITKVKEVTGLAICCHITPIIQANGVEQKQRRLSTQADAVLSPSSRMMLPRAVTFFKDLISKKAYKLLSRNLPFTVSHHQSDCRDSLPPRAAAARAWLTLAYLHRQRCAHAGAAAGGRSERNSVKRKAEPFL